MNLITALLLWLTSSERSRGKQLKYQYYLCSTRLDLQDSSMCESVFVPTILHF